MLANSKGNHSAGALNIQGGKIVRFSCIAWSQFRSASKTSSFDAAVKIASCAGGLHNMPPPATEACSGSLEPGRPSQAR